MTQPKIVVLDADPALGSAAHPEGSRLDPAELRELGELTVFDRTAPAELAARISDATIVLTNKVVLGRAELSSAPLLRLVSVLATGVNVIDLSATKERGIVVCNVPGYSTASTAQHTFALLLELCHRVGEHSLGVKAGKWSQSPSFSYFESELLELDGLTLGVVGYGAIGQRVAHLALAFGMRVLVHTRTPRDDSRFSFVDKETLLRRSDVVSLHCPLTKDTEHFIDEQALSMMRADAILLNCSRGPVVDERALTQALSSGRLRGAGLDVLCEEPPPKDHPLIGLPNVVVTPHVAWATAAARRRLLHTTVDNVRAFLEGEPQNVVSPPA